MTSLASDLIAWQRLHGRHDLPWQASRDPYVIWLSEIMLQQTQVGTVIPYFNRFMARFPDVRALADADEESVLALWSGLGYYARARNLHRAARVLCADHGGEFPRTLEQVMALPGIGRSTAGAICVFAFGQRHAILDGNVKRVLSRVFVLEGYPAERSVELRLWALARSLLPQRHIEAYTQGLMDLGATICVRARPRCDECPLSACCLALQKDRVADLPTPKARKPLPQRHTHMFMLWDGMEVLLHRRPATGLWGALWCFPESSDLAGISEDELMQRYGVSVTRSTGLNPVQHGFTHFKLTIYPRLIEVKRLRQSVAEPGVLWMTPADAVRAALPAPVRALLEQVLGDGRRIQ